MNPIKKAPTGNHTRLRRSNPVSGCLLTAALAAMCGKWKLIIVYWVAESPEHFAALRKVMPAFRRRFSQRNPASSLVMESSSDNRRVRFQRPSSIR